MGNWWPASAGAATAAATTKVVLVGATETGKSHFLAHAIGDGSQTACPTFGTSRETCIHNGVAIEFMESGSLAHRSGGPEYCQMLLEPFFGRDHWKCSVAPGGATGCLAWFIDEHDTVEDIHLARNDVIFIQRYFADKLSLLVVYNMGRPRVRRRAIVPGSQGHPVWREAVDDPKPPPTVHVAVHWEYLADVIDQRWLESVFARVMVTQLSYRDNRTIYSILDWLTVGK